MRTCPSRLKETAPTEALSTVQWSPAARRSKCRCAAPCVTSKASARQRGGYPARHRSGSCVGKGRLSARVARAGGIHLVHFSIARLPLLATASRCSKWLTARLPQTAPSSSSGAPPASGDHGRPVPMTRSYAHHTRIPRTHACCFDLVEAGTVVVYMDTNSTRTALPSSCLFLLPRTRPLLHTPSPKPSQSARSRSSGLTALPARLASTVPARGHAGTFARVRSSVCRALLGSDFRFPNALKCGHTLMCRSPRPPRLLRCITSPHRGPLPCTTSAAPLR